MRDGILRTLDVMAVAQAKPRTVATPWGPAGVVEEVSVPQRAGGKRFAVLVQLLETSTRRGPVTMRARDIERLRAALERAPVLGEALGL